MYFEFHANPDLSWGDAFWWSIVTMTTVGYGDHFPTTTGGRWFVGVPTMMLGIGLLGYLLSFIATAMLESKSREVRGLKKINSTNHVVICGFGSIERLLKLIEEIKRDEGMARSEVVIIDPDIGELPAPLIQPGILFVCGDASREQVLLQANIDHARAVIIQASEGSDDHNLKTILSIKSFAPDVFMVAECNDPENEIFFRRAKCDSVLCLTTLSEQMLIQELMDPGVAEIVADLTGNSEGKQFYIVDMKESFADYRAARKANSRAGHIPVGIRRGNENTLLPDDNFVLESGDRLILIASERPQ